MVDISPSDPHRALRRKLEESLADPEAVFTVHITREDVRQGDPSRATVPFHVAHEQAVVWQAHGKIRFIFDGYDRDPREMHQINEVRAFLTLLDSEAPAFLYFAEREQRLALSRCIWDPAREDATLFVRRKLEAVAALGAAYGFPAEAISEELLGDLSILMEEER